MVWGCFAGDTVSRLFRTQGTLDQQYAIPSGLRVVGLSFVFQQDNDPNHTSRLCKGYLTKKKSDGVLYQMTLKSKFICHERRVQQLTVKCLLTGSNQ